MPDVPMQHVQMSKLGHPRVGKIKPKFNKITLWIWPYTPCRVRQEHCVYTATFGQHSVCTAIHNTNAC